MDQKFMEKLKTQIKNAKGAVSDALKTEIINSLDSLFNQVALLQATVHNYTALIDSKDLTISTQTELIHTQKNFIENQKSLLQSQPLNQQQQMFTSANIDAEEKERRRCIVIARFPESSKETPSERIAEDNEKVKLLFDEMEIEATVAETFRMGSKKEAKNGKEVQPRLLKVRLQTSAQAKNILNNAKNVKNSTKFQNILLRKSMTAEERKFEKELFQKQKERIKELQRSNAHKEYTIYARKICIKKNAGKPEKINDPLNELKFGKHTQIAPQTPVNQSFQSSTPTPSGDN